MKTTTFALLGVLLVATVTRAHDHGDFGDGFRLHGLGFGDFGYGLGLGFGGHHDDGLWGERGFGLFNTDRIDQIQTRFSDKLDTLQTQYDDGVANATDFYTTSTYDTIVNKTQRLSDRYDLFVTGVEHSITRIDDIIALANDDISFYNDLLTNYESDTSISATKLERIAMWINRMTDRLTTKVDSLTMAQMTLQTNLPTYQMFQTDLSTFLDTIIAASGGSSSTTTSSSLSSLTSATATLSANVSSGSLSASSSLDLSAGAVPEPATMSFLLIGSLAVANRRRQRVRPT